MKMSLHISKKLALLQLTNCMTSGDVKTIKQLSDGKIFCGLIETIFPEIQFSLQPKEQNVSSDEPLQSEQLHGKGEVRTEDEVCSDPKIQSEGNIKKEPVPESNMEQTESVMNVCEQDDDEKSVLKPAPSSMSIEESFTQPVIPTGDDSKPVTEPVTDVDEENADISQRYKLIEYFIDDRYNLESKFLIAFPQCISGNEFELAKVAIFILSEVVRHKAHMNDSIIQTLSLLDIKVQQDLEQCFNYFINERSKITRQEIHKLLSSHSPYKVSSSPNKSAFSTPKRTCSSKYRRTDSPSTSPLQESVYTDSPLKTYFESPIFTKKDIISKEKELMKQRQVLYEEEVKSNTLQQTVKELEKKLKYKDNEINKLKTRLQDYEKNEECENCKKLENSIKETEKHIKELEKTLAEKESLMKEDMEKLSKQHQDIFMNYKVKMASRNSKVLYEINKAEKVNSSLELELDYTKFELYKREETIISLTEQLDEKTKECEIYKEKSTELEAKVKEMPESPVLGECLGKIIETENEELRARIKQLLLQVQTEEKVNAMIQCTGNSFNCGDMNSSNVSTHELPPSTNLSVNENSVMIKVENDVDESPITCDIFNKQDSSLKRPWSSISANSLTETNHSSVTSDGIGSLWKLYNNSSMSEDGNADRASIFSNVYKHATKTLNLLQNIGSEYQKSSKRLRVSSGPNGSSGFVSSPFMKELMGNLKLLQKSLLCLTPTEESQVQFQNNSISNMIDVKDSKVFFSKCNDSTEVKAESANSTVNSVCQNCEALLEKTQELDTLKEKYKNVKELFYHKKREFDCAKKKYENLKKENKENVLMLKSAEIKYQNLVSSLKETKKLENATQFSLQQAKFRFDTQTKGMIDKCRKLYMTLDLQRSLVRLLGHKYKNLKKELVLSRSENEKLHFSMNKGGPENEEVPLESETEDTVLVVPYTRGFMEPTFAREMNHHVTKQEPRIIKQEPASPDRHSKYEVTSLDIDKEDSVLTGALYGRSYGKNALHLPSADEEPILNHSSIADLDKNFENGKVQNRRHELNRRNTLCKPHLKSCYPAEDVPLTPAGKKMVSLGEGIKKERVIERQEPCGKKRKMLEIKTEDESANLPATPDSNGLFKTPSSLKTIVDFKRFRRPGCSKPKP